MWAAVEEGEMFKTDRSDVRTLQNSMAPQDMAAKNQKCQNLQSHHHRLKYGLPQQQQQKG
jgi:hypothetical protein